MRFSHPAGPSGPHCWAPRRTDPQATVADGAGRADRRGAESLADRVDGLLGEQPLLLVVKTVPSCEQVVEAQLVRRRA